MASVHRNIIFSPLTNVLMITDDYFFSSKSNSIANLKNMTLLEALQSKLLANVRENSDRLDESDGLCALWKEREWVSSLVPEKEKS